MESRSYRDDRERSRRSSHRHQGGLGRYFAHCFGCCRWDFGYLISWNGHGYTGQTVEIEWCNGRWHFHAYCFTKHLPLSVAAAAAAVRLTVSTWPETDTDKQHTSVTAMARDLNAMIPSRCLERQSLLDICICEVIIVVLYSFIRRRTTFVNAAAFSSRSMHFVCVVLYLWLVHNHEGLLAGTSPTLMCIHSSWSISGTLVCLFLYWQRVLEYWQRVLEYSQSVLEYS